MRVAMDDLLPLTSSTYDGDGDGAVGPVLPKSNSLKAASSSSAAMAAAIRDGQFFPRDTG